MALSLSRQPTGPPQMLSRPMRAPLLALAGTLALSACGSAHQATTGSFHATPGIGSADTTTLTPSSLSTSNPASTFAPTHFATRCSASHLKLGWGGRISEPTGQHTLSLTLTNASSAQGCYMFGYPEIMLTDSRGRALPLRYSRTGDQVVTSSVPSQVDVAPRSTAYVTLNKYRCDAGELMNATMVRVVPPDDYSSLQLSITGNVPMDYCGPGDPGSTVHLSPVEPSYVATISQP
ncbi:MAG: DUF4232 domain-containing protein [Chloroflexi bacterium]|nr:MAG: DUF4232 domain-containing protein [Chloroflexota bacterium]